MLQTINMQNKRKNLKFNFFNVSVQVIHIWLVPLLKWLQVFNNLVLTIVAFSDMK